MGEVPPLPNPEHGESWVCDANYLTCRHQHLLRFYDSQFIVDQRRIDGHVFIGCRKCEPSTYFFGVVTSRPSPMVTCYPISKAQFHEWNGSKAEPVSSQQMLHVLGYNPHWRGARP